MVDRQSLDIERPLAASPAMTDREVWALTTGEAGMTTQARSLSQAIAAHLSQPDYPWRVRVVTARPARWLGWLPVSLWLPFAARWALMATRFEDADTGASMAHPAITASEAILAALSPGERWPGLVVSCGRRSARVAAALRRYADQCSAKAIACAASVAAPRTISVHIQDPRIAWRYFDALVLSHHDARVECDGSTKGAVDTGSASCKPLIIRVEGALHGFTPARLATLRQRHAPDFSGAWTGLPRPWIGVAVGGSTRRFRLDERCVQAWAARLRQIIELTGGSLLLTSSRRTDPAAWDALLVALTRADHREHSEDSVQGAGCRVWAFAAHASEHPDAVRRLAQRPGLHLAMGDNPYPAMLALSDALVVSGDSVSMVSEAVGTGRPVGVLGADAAADWSAFGRGVARFHRRWLAQGRTFALDSDASTAVFVEHIRTAFVGRRDEDDEPAGATAISGSATPKSEVERAAEALVQSALFGGVASKEYQAGESDSIGRYGLG